MAGQKKVEDQTGEKFVIEDGVLISEMGEEIPLNLDDSDMTHHRFEAMDPAEMQLAEEAGMLLSWND